MTRLSPFPPVQPTNTTVTKNDKVRKALAQHGDNGAAVRHVMHFLFHCGNLSCSVAEMADELRSRGFVVDLAKCTAGVIAEEYREVASADFDSLTQALADLAHERGWKYDGFECAVEVMH